MIAKMRPDGFAGVRPRRPVLSFSLATGSVPQRRGDRAMTDRCHLIATGLVLLLLAGCASDNINASSAFDPLHPFPSQATYAWDAAANRLPNDPRFEQLDLHTLITEAANEEFSLRGYRQAAAGSPTFRLSYQLAVHTWIGSNNSRSVGSLALTLNEAESGRRVWMGFARAEVNVGLTDAERKERLRTVVARILEKFPPNQRGD